MEALGWLAIVAAVASVALAPAFPFVRRRLGLVEDTREAQAVRRFLRAPVRATRERRRLSSRDLSLLASDSGKSRPQPAYPPQLTAVHAQGEADLATDLDMLERDKTVFAEMNDPWAEANVLNLIGFVEERNSRFEEAVTIHRRALELFRRVGDPLGVSDSLNDLGVVFGRLGQNEEALANHEEALHLRERLGNKARVSNSNNNLGVLFAKSQPEKASELFATAAKLARFAGDARGLGKIINNSAVLSMELTGPQGDLNVVCQQFRLSLTLRDASEDQRGNAKTRNNLGLIHFLNGDWEEAQKYFGEAAALAGNVEDNVGLLHVLENWLALIDSSRSSTEPRERIQGRIDDLINTAPLPEPSVLSADCESYAVGPAGGEGVEGGIALLSSGSTTPGTAAELRERRQSSSAA